MLKNVFYRHYSRGIFILGQEYVVYPDTFNDFIADYMHKNVSGFASYEEANDKWTSYFNDARKKEKAKQNVGYRLETPKFPCKKKRKAVLCFFFRRPNN